MINISQIRNLFTNFFSENHHKIIPSSSLIPQNDPTLLFTNSGMVQFKDYFTGNKKPDFNSAVSIQKCLRVGGKHNDLENVGYTNIHHTFFEMLGNFSFGGYGKEQAIYLAWKFITQELSLPSEKLYVTVYHTDHEAADLWKKISNLSNDRIICVDNSDNFWSMGEVGVCGPCSEIFYDNGYHIPGGLPGSKNADGDRFVEIWNLVFMQYDRDIDGNHNLLPNIGIDTGMGLERISAVIQGVLDNYDTDLFQKLIQESQKISGNHNNKIANKIITDHLRAASFLIADGIIPTNHGRGYVLRRIIRRAIRFSYQIGCKKPILCDLFPTLEKLMNQHYPELTIAAANITHTLKTEEENFLNTLENGLGILSEMITVSDLKPGNSLSGSDAFKLYDTYGFPLDITIDLLKEKDIKVDQESFEQAMKQQKKQAKAAWVGSGETGIEQVWFQVLEKCGKTEFIDSNDISCKLMAIVKDGKILSDNEYRTINTDDKITIILEQTPFYAESGGQLGDKGVLTVGLAKLKVIDTKKILNAIHAHICIIESGTISNENTCFASFDQNRRQSLKVAHSATHLLHFVLRQVLGKHVTQKGSLVAEDRLRFDFNHNKALTDIEIQEIEEKVNNLIWKNNKVTIEIVHKNQAIESGAMALFGEKYDDNVRVVKIGNSIELCGGTHVKSSTEIGIFKIAKESSIGSNIRRIEAFTRNKARKFLHDKVESYIKEIDCYKQKLKEEAKKSQINQNKLYNSIIDNLDSKDIKINNIKFIIKMIDEIPVDAVREVIKNNIKENDKTIILFFSNYKKKHMCFIGVSKDLIQKISADQLIKIAAQTMHIKGGGGKPELAQCSASEQFFNQVITEMRNYIILHQR